MGWVLVCVVVAILGLAYLVLQAREVWRKARLLLVEVEAAAGRAGDAAQPVSQGNHEPAARSRGRIGT